MQTYQCFKTALACSNCHQIKQKCDRTWPCGRCQSRNVACEPRYRRPEELLYPSGTAGDMSAIAQATTPPPAIIPSPAPTQRFMDPQIPMLSDSLCVAHPSLEDNGAFFSESDSGFPTPFSADSRLSPGFSHINETLEDDSSTLQIPIDGTLSTAGAINVLPSSDLFSLSRPADNSKVCSGRESSFSAVGENVSGDVPALKRVLSSLAKVEEYRPCKTAPTVCSNRDAVNFILNFYTSDLDKVYGANVRDTNYVASLPRENCFPTDSATSGLWVRQYSVLAVSSLSKRLNRC